MAAKVASTPWLLAVCWANPLLPQGTAQAHDAGTASRACSAHPDESQRRAADPSRAAFHMQLASAGYGAITTEIRPVADAGASFCRDR